jgi:transcriptional regulator with XRE-family HTH domain
MVRDLAELVKFHRGKAGLTQEQLAEKAELSVAAIRDLESGRTRKPQARTLEQLARAWGLDDDARAQLLAAGSGRQEPAEAVPAAPGSPLDEAAGILAGQVLQQWREEAVIRRLTDPLPLDVRWARRGGGPAFRGGARSVVEAFRKLAPPRLVVLGPPGSGKTGLLVLLTIGLLEDRHPKPVAILLSVASWDARRQGFHAWVSRRLQEDYPRLRTLGPDVAGDLVQQGRVMPVLDGLDELPSGLRAKAVDALRRLGPSQPLVVACRSPEYEELSAGDPLLPDALVIELEPLEPAMVVDYLRRGARRWQPVVSELSGGEREALIGALSTPLMASVARAVYEGGRADPGELLDERRFPSRTLIEDHLLDGLIHAAFEDDPPGDGRRRWRRDEALRWLTFLAVRLQQRGTRDLALWDLSPWRPSATPLLCLTGIVLFGLVGHALGGGYILLLMTVGGAGFGFLIGCTDERWTARMAPRLDRRFILGLLRGLLRGLRMALLMVLGLEAVFGTIVVLAIGSWTWALAVLVLAAALTIPVCVAFCVGSALLGGLVRTSGEVVSPRVALRSDGTALTLTLATTGLGLGIIELVLAIVPAFVAWVLFVLHLHTRGAIDFTAPLRSIVLPFGLVGLATIVAVYPWPKYIAARAWFALMGRLPWRLMAFLDDAHHLGILRQVGPVYQFRHARLEERLAGDVRPVERVWAPLRVRIRQRSALDWLRGASDRA